MEQISEERAQAFAQALINNHGNATAAARSLNYDDAPQSGHRMSRHPLVQKALAPMAHAQLQSLTPQAIRTLGHLLNNGSPYVRLEAAKDVLDRNGVGTSREPPKSAQLVVNINLVPAAPVLDPATLDLTAASVTSVVSKETPLENSDISSSTTSSAYDFSPEALQPLANGEDLLINSRVGAEINEQVRLEKEREQGGNNELSKFEECDSWDL